MNFPRTSSPMRRISPIFCGLLLLALLSAGCSSARQRESPIGISSLLRYRDPETHAYFKDVYRTGNLYQDFRPALIVDAILKDQEYRVRFVEMLKEQFFLNEEEAGNLQAEQDRLFDTRFEILLFTYEGRNPQTDLHKKDAPWKLLLRDDDGQLSAPTEISKIKKDSNVYLYLQKFFIGLDRWSRAYLVKFPKLTKSRLGQPVGEKPFELIITGVKGTIVLKWEDPRIFYRTAKKTGKKNGKKGA